MTADVIKDLVLTPPTPLPTPLPKEVTNERIAGVAGITTIAFPPPRKATEPLLWYDRRRWYNGSAAVAAKSHCQCGTAGGTSTEDSTVAAARVLLLLLPTNIGRAVAHLLAFPYTPLVQCSAEATWLAASSSADCRRLPRAAAAAAAALAVAGILKVSGRGL